MASLTGLLAGYNEQRDANTNYLRMLEAMRASRAGSDLDQQRLSQQQAQFAKEMQFREDQADQAAQAQEDQSLANMQAQSAASLSQSMADMRQSSARAPQEMAQLAQVQRQGEARNVLKDLMANGGDVSTAELGRALLPYDPSTGINLIKASKEEQKQQALLDRTGGTGVAAPQGYRWTQDGNLEAIPGGNADPRVMAQLEGIKSAYKAKEPKALTESQGNATAFGMRAAESAKIIDDLAAKGVFTGSLIKQGVESLPLVGGALGMAANSLVASPEQQQVEQAQSDFVNAVLRKESGASISPAEFDKARKQYFAQPGDSPQVQAQKQANRETAIHALTIQAGPGGENIPRSSGQAAPTHNSLPDPRQYNGKIARDTETGTRWMSNGRDWVRAP
jgi:hypothetical protein